MAESNSPNIIFNLSGFVYGSKSEKNDFIRCKNSFNIIEYLNRKSAMQKSDIVENNEILMDESLEVKGDWNIASYAAHRKGSAGAFSLNKTKLEKEDLKEIKKQLRTTKSTVWTSVLSFTPMEAKDFCNSVEQAQSIIKKHLPKLLEGSMLDINNVTGFGAFHVNTAHPHIHFVFWEKTPQRINSKGKITYNYNNPTQKPYLPKECLSNFKFSVAKDISNIRQNFWAFRDIIRQNVKENFSDKAYFNLLTSLLDKDKDIVNKTGKQYGRLSALEKKQIDKSVDALINANPKTKKVFDLYTKLLMQVHLQNIKILNDNKMPVPERTKLFYDSRIKELRSRLGNEYLANMKKFAEAHNNYNTNRQNLVLRSDGQSSSSFMRGIRGLKKPLKKYSNIILSSMEKAVHDEVVFFKNNLDKYFEELKAKGVDLIYGEEKRRTGTETDETFE